MRTRRDLANSSRNAGVTLIVHCAAKVGDWGPVDEYMAVNVRHQLTESALSPPTSSATDT